MEHGGDRSADELLARLLSLVTGRRNLGEAEHANLERNLLGIKHHFDVRWPELTSPEAERRKPLLQKMLVTAVELLELRQQLGPEGEEELQLAAWTRLNLGGLVNAAIDNQEFPKDIDPIDPEDFVTALRYEIQNIQFFLSKGSPRKTAMRRALIEPFLMFLEVHDLWESAKPMSEVMDALFDFVGVDQTRRPTDPGIRTIVREFKLELKIPGMAKLLAVKHRFKIPVVQHLKNR